MIAGIFGNLSSGKTLLGVKTIFEEKQKNPNLKIISNIYLKMDYDQLDLEGLLSKVAEDKEYFRNAVLFIDEIHNLVDARKSTSNLNVDFTRFVTQIGKLNCNMIFTSQIFSSQIDLRLRELCDVLFFCKRVNEKGQAMILRERKVNEKIFIFVTYFFKEFGGLVFKQGKFVFSPEKYYGLYDTEEIVVLDRTKYLSKNTFFN